MPCVFDGSGRNPFYEKVRELGDVLKRGDMIEVAHDKFGWAHLHAIGIARKSVKSDKAGDVESIAYCYIGGSYVMVDEAGEVVS